MSSRGSRVAAAWESQSRCVAGTKQSGAWVIMNVYTHHQINMKHVIKHANYVRTLCVLADGTPQVGKH
jgi:hypothetical protein